MAAPGLNSNPVGPGAMFNPQPGMQLPAAVLVDQTGAAVAVPSATSATQDSNPPSGVVVEGMLLYNGTTYDRWRGSNGTANVGLQNAFTLYSESAVVNGARLTNGNTNGGTLINQAQWALVSVNVTVLSGGTGPTLVYSLQVQDTNGNYVTAGSTATISATGTYGFSVGPGMANGWLLPAGNGQYRVSWVVTGSPTGVTSQIGVTGR